MTGKAAIPRALKNAVWVHYIGKKFEAKCRVAWCTTVVTPFTFETGHNVPESKGGATNVANLRPICSQCNKSMGNTYTIDEFSARFASQHVGASGSWWRRTFGPCVGGRNIVVPDSF
jgi:hypothetical protein